MYAVIKGDGYGHGIVAIANTVVKSNVDGIAVATLDEALIVRKYHPDVKILCLGIIRNEDIIKVCNQNITICIANLTSADFLKDIILTKPLKVHLKVNTGMNRIGLKKVDDLQKIIALLKNNEHVDIEGIFMHLATAEDYDKEDYLTNQLATFKKIIDQLNYPFKQIHCTNSASLLKFHQDINFTNTNRATMCIYGALEDEIINEYNLRPALTLKSKINMV